MEQALHELQVVEAAALECVRNRPAAEGDGGLLVADIGTGCGAMALALGALEPRIGHIYAVDVSADALRAAEASLESRFDRLDVRPMVADFTNGFRLPPCEAAASPVSPSPAPMPAAADHLRNVLRGARIRRSPIGQTRRLADSTARSGVTWSPHASRAEALLTMSRVHTR